MERQCTWTNCVIAIAEGKHAIPMRCDPDVLAHMDGFYFEENCLPATIASWPEPGIYLATIEFWFARGPLPIESDFDFRFTDLRRVDWERLPEIAVPYDAASSTSEAFVPVG